MIILKNSLLALNDKIAEFCRRTETITKTVFSPLVYNKIGIL